MLTAPSASLPTSPTTQNYGELQRAYDHFNAELFAGKLPPCLITLQREKRTCGYFSSMRFAHLDGRTTDEIAMNPAYFAVVPLVETMQTLVHEMVHLWQAHFGTPGRGRYHNAQWANKMESIGLMPSSTGHPGGARTGDCMGDYAMEGGAFLAACASLITDKFQLSWYDRFPAHDMVSAGQHSASMALGATVGGGSTPSQSVSVAASLVVRPEKSNAQNQSPNKSNRVKYTCRCGHNMWAKPTLRAACMECDSVFEPATVA